MWFLMIWTAQEAWPSVAMNIIKDYEYLLVKHLNSTLYSKIWFALPYTCMPRAHYALLICIYSRSRSEAVLSPECARLLYYLWQNRPSCIDQGTLVSSVRTKSCGTSTYPVPCSCEAITSRKLCRSASDELGEAGAILRAYAYRRSVMLWL